MPLAATGLLLGIVITTWVPGSAAAQGMSAEQACTPDVFRLCNDYIPDRGRITACLHAKRSALSPACRPFFAGAKKATAAKYKKRKKPRKRG